MSISPARIVLDLYEAPEKAWCWRDDWATGWDSIYGLLSKWAKLNSIDAPALVSVFLRGDTGKKATLIRNPGIDPRNSDLLDRQLIASNLRLSPEYVSRAFTADVFPSGHRKIAEFLRLCPECLSNGFHAAVHQIDYLGICPIHGTRMRTTCTKCHAQQPYQLNRASFEKPFACCKCGYIFAGLVYEPATKSLQLDATQASCMADTTKLARYADEVLILAGRGRLFLVCRRVAFAAAWSGWVGFPLAVRRFAGAAGPVWGVSVPPSVRLSPPPALPAPVAWARAA